MLGILSDYYDFLISALEVKAESELTANFIKENLIIAYLLM